MRILRLLPVFLFFSLLLAPLAAVPASALEYPSPGAEYVVLVETTSDQVLFKKGESARAYPASLTKIMTVLLACEAIESGAVSASDMVTASDNVLFDLAEDSSTANIVPGETMAFQDLMYCALIKSANEACNIIAEHVSGSISAFVDLMNSRARELGCTGTLFANTHGMPDDGHYTTAWDMYLILEAAMNHSLFLEISSTRSIEIPSTNISTPRVLENTNALLGDSELYKGYAYEYAKCGKTGFTSAAGHCLASSASKGDIELIAIVMKAQSTERDDGSTSFGHFSDSILLYNWAFENFSYQDIIKQTEVIATLPVAMGSDSDTISVSPERSISVLLPNDIDPFTSFERDITLYSEISGEQLQAPINAGEVLGEITLSRDGVNYGSIQLVSKGSVELSKSYYMMAQIKETLSSGAVRAVIIVLAALLLLYLVVAVRYRVLRMRHRLSVRRARKKRAGYEGYTPRPASSLHKQYIDVDNFDEEDYYKNEPVGWAGPAASDPGHPEEAYDLPVTGHPEADDAQTGEDSEKSSRDFYEEFFK